MFKIRIDASDVMQKLDRLKQNLPLNIATQSTKVAEIIAAEVRRDLRDKILRPRESTGLLESEIEGVTVWRGKDLIVGVGDIARLTARVPYWRLQDEGGPVPSRVVPGFFVDESGRRVPFDDARAPIAVPGGANKQSMDVFIYSPLHGWTSPHNYMSIAEAAQGVH